MVAILNCKSASGSTLMMRVLQKHNFETTWQTNVQGIYIGSNSDLILSDPPLAYIAVKKGTAVQMSSKNVTGLKRGKKY